MKKYSLAALLVLAIINPVQAEFHPETVFGLNVPVYIWGWQADLEYMGSPGPDRLVDLTDAANLRIASGNELVDIILLIDHAACCIHWLRTPANLSPRPLEYIGQYGEFGSDIGQFSDVTSVAVASTGPYFDPQNDYIYVADRMNYRIVKLKFNFNPTSPQNDYFTWVSSTSVDATFTPSVIKYANINPGNRAENRLLAIDDNASRIVVFSDNGSLLQTHSLSTPSDSGYCVYTNFTCKIESDSTLMLYVINSTWDTINRYHLTNQGSLEFLNALSMGDWLTTSISDINYQPQLGLWVMDNSGPHIYQVAEDLSAILGEINEENFNPQLLDTPFAMIFFPERLVILEGMSLERGIVTFASDQPLAKYDPRVPESLPLVFALHQNFPNPFNPNTKLSFELPSAGWVKLEIFNILGQRVKTLLSEYHNPGRFSVIWNGKNDVDDDVASGVYLAKLTSGDNTNVRKMTLLK